MAADATVSVWAARPALAALVERRIDPEPALRAARLSHKALMQIENRLPRKAVEQFWETAALAARDRSFGVHVAETLPKGNLDLIEYLGSTSATVGESWERMSEYIRIHYDRSNLHLVVEPRHARLVRRITVPAPQYNEFSFTLILTRSRQWTGIDWNPERMTFQHARPDDDGELTRVFRCPLGFSARQIEMRCARRILKLPHKNADSRLLEILLRYADSLVTALPSRGNVIARARSAIARQLTRAVPTLSSTAAFLRTPPRTLQRRFAQEGHMHSELVDEVRRDLAFKYIGDAGLSVAEMSYLLHFSDATAFYRAFKRWTGESPLHYRQKILEDV